MASNGVNAVRTYTSPPRWLLDAAQRHGLYVLVGLALERYVGFLTDTKGAPDIEGLIRAKVRGCAGHPALLECYLARLHNVVGDRPLVMSEVGLDSVRHGEVTQAGVLDWQVRTVFEAGCAGVFVYAWTDEWFRGGEEVTDWAFGLTRRDRDPKPALDAVRDAFADVPFSKLV